MLYLLYSKYHFRFTVILILIFICACVNHDRDDDDHSDDDTQNLDDSISVDDSQSDDSIPDDDTASDDADGGVREVDPYVKWCLDLGTLPPEPGWTWTNLLIGQYKHPDSPKPFIASYGETIWVQWLVLAESDGTRPSFLGRYENGEWTQWQLVDPSESSMVVVGVATDADGGVWSVLFGAPPELSPVRCALARWEDGQIAEVIPVMEESVMAFTKLFVLPDGRFAFTYYDGPGLPALIEQREDGGFVKMTSSIFGTDFTPDSQGMMHGFHIIGNDNFGVVIHQYATANGFKNEFAGFAAAGGESYVRTATDSQDNLYFTSYLKDDLLYLGRFQGGRAVLEPWTQTPSYDFASNASLMGVDHQDRPFTFISNGRIDLYDDFCMMMKENDGVRSEFIAQFNNDEGGLIIEDQTAMPSGAMGVVGYLLWYSEQNELYENLRLFIRQSE